jgi:Cu2+-exporting ATPase
VLRYISMERKYTCSMHPEIVSDKPGKCPQCGMPLVAKASRGKARVKNDDTAHGNHQMIMDHKGHDHLSHHEMMAQDFKKRFWVSLPLTLTVLVLSPKIQGLLGFSLVFPLSTLVLFILATIIYFYGGKPFFSAAKGELASRNYGMMTLVSLAISASYIFSVVSTFTFKGESFYWEMATLVLAFLFGHWMEMRAVVGTGGALQELAKLIPPSAHKYFGKEIKDVETKELDVGDLVLVKPGEKIPADGMVVEGRSSVNEALITGESRPVSKAIDSEVIGGTINGDGSLTIKVTKTGKDSALSQIITLVSQAQQTKPSVQNLADRAANWLTIIAIVAGTLTFSYWYFATANGIIFAATLAITVIVITCPHALGLAIPTVTTITSSLAAKNGILIRDMKGLEMAKDVDYVVFDKTGTLTQGNFGVSKIITSQQSQVTKRKLVSLAAAVEQHSEHSIAKGIVAYAKKKNIKIPKATKFKAIKGKGAWAKVGKSKVVVGNWKMVKEAGDLMTENDAELTGTTVYVMKDKKLLGRLVLEDQIREESRKAVKALHKIGIKVAMLTGDKKEVAKEVGKELGIDKVFSEVLPKDKVDKIKQLQDEGYKVAMVGDGVNDAPSLTQAHVGIAIGAGTSVAIESAEIVLVKNNPLDVLKVRNLAMATERKMKQNLAWATGYNSLAIPAAAGLFYPWGITLRPEWGALLMSASSVIVVANALMLRKVKL